MRLIIARDGESKLILADAEIRPDGTIWSHNMPVLGITDPVAKARAAAAVRAGRYEEIPADAYTRLGDNRNGLWASTPEQWAEHPVRIARAAAIQAADAVRVEIILSSRGWGDYSPVRWSGDITRPDAEIAAECRQQLAREHDVDQPNPSDADLLAMIHAAHARWETRPTREAAYRKEQAEDRARKIATGYCFACESYCHGDCGAYSADPATQDHRELREAAREAAYGMDDNT